MTLYWDCNGRELRVFAKDNFKCWITVSRWLEDASGLWYGGMLEVSEKKYKPRMWEFYSSCLQLQVIWSNALMGRKFCSFLSGFTLCKWFVFLSLSCLIQLMGMDNSNNYLTELSWRLCTDMHVKTLPWCLMNRKYSISIWPWPGFLSL